MYFSIVEFSYSAYKIQAPDTRISHSYIKFHPSAHEFLHAYVQAPQVVYICHVYIHENQYACFYQLMTCNKKI